MDSLLNVVSLFCILVGTSCCCVALSIMFRAIGQKIKIDAVDVVHVIKARGLYTIAFVFTFLFGYSTLFMRKFSRPIAVDNQPVSIANLFDLPFAIPHAVSVIIVLLHIPVGLWLLYLWKVGVFDLIEKHKEMINNSDTQDG